jgi:hypothetical protein
MNFREPNHDFDAIALGGLSSQPKVIHEGAAILNDNFRLLIVDFLRLAA